ncbi:MAG: ABC transporter ATP-binding protein [Pseudomonadota bacterium]
MLTVKELTKAFGGLVAVSGASFELAEGRITGLIGPNGAGKTTTFSMIAGALKPTSGSVAYVGRDITGLSTHKLFHQGVVRTFQIPHEFGLLTVLENLMVVPGEQPGENIFKVWLSPGRVRDREKAVRRRAEETLEFLNLSPLRHELAQNLSGGQKKLLELGRAMMTDARLVLLDEPGAGVNPTLMKKLGEMIRRLNQERGYTFCIIEHDMDLIASLCDPVIVLAEGQVLVAGDFRQIRRDERVLDAYLGGGED